MPATLNQTNPAHTTDEQPAWVEAGKAWSRHALDWAYRFESYGNDAIESIFGRLGIGPDTDLLDMACGSGLAATRAARLGATVAGLDASDALINIAQRRTPNADFVVGDMFELPWDGYSFDVVTSFNGIWGGCDAALAEAHRVLRPGGSVGLTFWGRGSNLDMRDWFFALGMSAPSVGEELIATSSIGTPGVVEEMLAITGFTNIERWDVSAILEFADEDDAWKAFRSPGVVAPALDALGENELRSRLMPTVEHLRAADGSYRIVNELTCVTATVRK